MRTVKEIDAEMEKLLAEREQAVSAGRVAALSEAKALIKAYSFTMTELGVKPLRKRKKKTEVADETKNLTQANAKQTPLRKTRSPKKA